MVNVAESDIKRLVAAFGKNPKTSVVLYVDRLTPYSQVIRILDSVRLGGCFRTVLEAKKQATQFKDSIMSSVIRKRHPSIRSVDPVLVHLFIYCFYLALQLVFQKID